MSPSTSGTVLVLGGTGKVGSRLVPLLTEASIPTLVASRSGKAPAGSTGVKFDWDDESTWEPILANPDSVRAVFLIGPGSPDHSPVIKFIDVARGKGVRRFVLLSASSVEEGGPLMGVTHKRLHELGNEGKIEWAVLRPSWFMQNFLETYHVKPIKEENKLYSATGPGRIPWVSAEDIAAVAFHALTSPQPPNTDFLVLGPELLKYTDLAEIFTSVLGRKITYHELTEAELVAQYQHIGVPAEYAAVLAAMDTNIRNGAEDRTNDVVRTVGVRRNRGGSGSLLRLIGPSGLELLAAEWWFMCKRAVYT
ncbi:putative ergot alkaloid A [Hypoxylon sp. FL0890]|nr:putative ergot alkaloid A [Hypoxylon sp. FL0890]